MYFYTSLKKVNITTSKRKYWTGIKILHVVFWITNAIIFVFPFILKSGFENKSKLDNYTPGLLLFTFLLIIVYVNYSILIPKYASKGKIGLYFASVTIAVLSNNALYALVTYLIIKKDFHIEDTISFLSLEFLYIIITSFFKFFKEWIENQGLKLKIMDVQKQKIEAELNALKSQLNPHFLFNVLNNIYSHSLLKSDVTPKIVLKLSDLMSYILYDCKTDLVPLSKEIEFIENYIDLEKIRLEEEIDITIEKNNINTQLICPLLLIPLIENAFKHGKGSMSKHKFIKLSFSDINGDFFFNIQNPYTKQEVHTNENRKGGIGISNVKKRLSLLYNEDYQFNILEMDDTFEIRIVINNCFNT